MKKKILHIGIIGIFIICIIWFSLSNCYYISQGCSLLSIYSKAEEIDELLESEELAQDDRELLLLVKDIKSYAIEILGLNDNDNYTKYIHLDRDYLVVVVSACESDSFNQYKWHFIFMGAMPYKGFFSEEDALNEGRSLKEQGYDVYIRKVDAFSTLGILSDPIFSFMKQYSIYSLANIIFHEQMHTTLFLKENVDFSENLALFIGNEGALQFIRYRYGEDSREYTQAINIKHDSAIFRSWIKDLYDELTTLYNQEIEKQSMLAGKAQIISNWKERLGQEYESNFKTDMFKNIIEIKINNAFIATYMNYTSNLALFYELYQVCDYDLNKFLHVVKGVEDYKQDAFAYIEQYIKQQKSM